VKIVKTYPKKKSGGGGKNSVGDRQGCPKHGVLFGERENGGRIGEHGLKMGYQSKLESRSPTKKRGGIEKRYTGNQEKKKGGGKQKHSIGKKKKDGKRKEAGRRLGVVINRPFPRKKKGWGGGFCGRRNGGVRGAKKARKKRQRLVKVGVVQKKESGSDGGKEGY